MGDISKNDIKATLAIIKSPKTMYNANNLSGVLNLTAMGMLKILKKLSTEHVLVPKQMGKATFYSIDEDEYATDYTTLMLKREAENASAPVKRWIHELKKIKHADMLMLYGSVLHKKEPKDIDVLVVTDKKRFAKVKKEIEELNNINIKQIHPLYQTREDLISNIKKKDKVVLNAIKGIVVTGHNLFVEVYHESRKK